LVTSREEVLVGVPPEVARGAAVVTAAEGVGCVCTAWLCGGGVAGCGKYFFNSGWNASITMNVSRKTSIRRFSLPGSCCGFLISGKVTVSSDRPAYYGRPTSVMVS
jgi:hypothetical protein